MSLEVGGREDVGFPFWIEAAISRHFTRNKVKVLELLLPFYFIFQLISTGRDKDCVMIRLAVYFSGILFCALGILHSREKKQIVIKQIKYMAYDMGGFDFLI